MNETEKKLAEELERTRDDEGEWSQEPVEVDVQQTPRTQVLSFRLPLDELEQVTTAAKASGETLSEFVRNAIELRLSHSISPSIALSHMLKTFTVYAAPRSSGWNEPPAYASLIGEKKVTKAS
ncbi:MAG: ribbon-helix-helix protein, CopG family [Actinomycetota bacterium]